MKTTVESVISAISAMNNCNDLSIAIKYVVDDSVVYFGSFADVSKSNIIKALQVTNWSIENNMVCIYTNYSFNGKYIFDVCLIAEEITSGQIKLTLAEALLVERVTNIENWSNLYEESYSGSFGISLNLDAITIHE